MSTGKGRNGQNKMLWRGKRRPFKQHRPTIQSCSIMFAFLLLIILGILLRQSSAFLQLNDLTPLKIPPSCGCYKKKPLQHQSEKCRFTHVVRNVNQKVGRERSSQLVQQAVAVTSIPISTLYLGALAMQFGIQPILTKSFTPKGIIRSTVIMAQDVTRFVLCFLLLLANGNWHSSVQSWTWQGGMIAAGIPSLLYMVQNYFTLMAYQSLPPVTFNILNQTKTLSAALCCYLLLGRRQSALQVMSLLLLLLSALVIEKIIPLPSKIRNISSDQHKQDATNDGSDAVSTSADDDDSNTAEGVIPILIASFISGLAGAISQRNLQVYRRDVYIFSMELSAISIITMTCTLLFGSPDGKKVRRYGLTKEWTWKTWIPVFTNALGGVIVGLVTKHSGAVRKGFALIFGLLLSAILQNHFSPEGRVGSEQICGGILASISVWMHSRFPPSV